MGYTKDIVLSMSCKRKIWSSKFENWTSLIKELIINNKFIIITLALLTALIIIDLLLVNSFFSILSNIY